jgi:hypothetical protein
MIIADKTLNPSRTALKFELPDNLLCSAEATSTTLNPHFEDLQKISASISNPWP